MPTQNFTYTGGWQKFNVPKDVEAVFVELRGGGSGSKQGGLVTGRLAVNGNQVLYIMVGQAGRAPSGDNGGERSFGGGGAGGDGTGSGSGGRGGGGASAIRLNSTSGTIKAVAGGAGGNSGDSGAGGHGGANTGQSGSAGSSGTGAVGAATGGTQTQGGNGGTSSLGADFSGGNAPDTGLGRGGAGGVANQPNTNGGGGGGGGFRAGGGGQAGAVGVAPGGGGGGGSNYTKPLTGASSAQGTGGTGNGLVVVTWVVPPPGNQPPSSPTEVKVNDVAESEQMATKARNRVRVSARLDDPDKGQDVRLVARYSRTPTFARSITRRSDWIEQTKRATVVLDELEQDSLYYVRLFTEDRKGLLSLSYNLVTFWTNRAPNPADLTGPAENAQISNLLSVLFEWNHTDPDSGDGQRSFRFRYRRAGSPTEPVGAWTLVEKRTAQESHTLNPGVLKANRFYEWQVRTQDPQERWGPWSLVRSLYITGTYTEPDLVSPGKDEAVRADLPVTLRWRFNDPDKGDDQAKADVRWRVAGTTDWVTVLGDITTPGTDRTWEFPAYTFPIGYRMEWQARTYDQGSGGVTPSDWSDPEFFYTMDRPGSGADPEPIPAVTDIQGSLGCGQYTVFVYDRGGMTRRGQIEPLSALTWGRKRDDIANAIVVTNGFGDDCCSLLASLRSWLHEIVIFRDKERVFEGPITRITYRPDSVEIEAKDVMAYLYRRVMRQGYNDSYRLVDGQQTGLHTVVERAGLITMNALAPDDPNLLQYLTLVEHTDDARQSRVVPDFSRTAWEEIDDLAATAGLDYVAVGRRIIYWDTHEALGRLPEMRDGDFSDPPIVTEYGMQLANYFAVSNNNGVAGTARPVDEDFPGQFYGQVEMLASAYGEAGAGPADVLTPTARAELIQVLKEQARRNIAGRWPTPVVVRVPDNTSLNPDVNLSIRQLVPGVWIPLRSTGTCREVVQWQKLDAVNVEATGDGSEFVRVVMSPAPKAGEDFDDNGLGDDE